jgi:hypothetical protein
MGNNLSTLIESEEPNSASQVVADVVAQKKRRISSFIMQGSRMASFEVECGDPVYWTFK